MEPAVLARGRQRVIGYRNPLTRGGWGLRRARTPNANYKIEPADYATRKAVTIKAWALLPMLAVRSAAFVGAPPTNTHQAHRESSSKG